MSDLKSLAVGAIVGAGVTAVVLLSMRGEPGASPAGAAPTTASRSGAPAAPLAAAPVASAEAPAETAKLRDENVALKAELAQSKGKVTELEARVATLAASASTSASASAKTSQADGGKDPLRVAFGEAAKLEEVRKIDWREAATAIRNMLEPIKELKVKLAKGEELPDGLGIKIAKENSKLQKIAFSVNGKLKTYSSGNGEFTHPLVLANLIAEHLELAERPLDEGQAREIARLGDDYETRAKAQVATYDNRTPLLEKLMDELELKRVFRDKVEAVLTPAQRELIVAGPDVRDVAGIDLYSPVLMLQGRMGPLAAPSTAKLREALVKNWTARWKTGETAVPALEAAADAYLRAVEPRLVPVAETETAWFRLDDALAAGRATVAAIKELLRTLPPSDEMTKAMLKDAGLPVPRLVKTEAAK